MQIIILKNNTPRILSFEGKDLGVGEEFEVNSSMQQTWKLSQELFELVAHEDIIVNNGIKNLNPSEGWKWFLGNADLPRSEVGDKLWVHSSAKPIVDGKMFYSQWIGAGDNVEEHLLGQGPLAVIQNTPGTPKAHIDFVFDESFGDVYIHEGFAMWENAKLGDSLNALIVAEGTHLQQSVNLDLILDEDGYVLYSQSGPGTGTHGFASPPYLLPRSYSKDGDWDYSEQNGLTPNFTKTGGYKICANEATVHRFINRIPVLGTNTDALRLVSEDTFKVPHGYFLRLECNNASNSDWTAAFIITAYRERTFQP
jgi:hypothetical protein